MNESLPLARSFNPAFSSPPFVPDSNTASAVTREDLKKPSIIKVTSFFFFSLSLISFFQTLAAVAVILILNSATLSAVKGAIAFYFLRDFPSIAILPIIGITATLIYLYSALKLRCGSRKSWFIGLFSLIAMTLFTSIIIVSMFHSFTEIYSEGHTSLTHSIGKFIRFNVFFLFGVILLLYGWNKFSFADEAISKRSKQLFSILAIVLILPVGIFLVFAFGQAYDTNYGYRQIQATTPYRIYKPSQLLPNLVYLSKFYLDSDLESRLANKSEKVKVIFGKALYSETSGPAPIVVSQVGVEPGFDLKSYAQTSLPNYTSLTEVDIKNAREAILLEKKGEKLTAIKVLMITPDNVLVELVSAAPKNSPQDLITFAEYFE